MKLLTLLGKACSLSDRKARTTLPPKGRPFKHSDETVGHIKWYLNSGWPTTKISEQCGVTPNYVNQVRNEIVRAHIKPLDPDEPQTIQTPAQEPEAQRDDAHRL